MCHWVYGVGTRLHNADISEVGYQKLSVKTADSLPAPDLHYIEKNLSLFLGHLSIPYDIKNID